MLLTPSTEYTRQNLVSTRGRFGVAGNGNGEIRQHKPGEIPCPKCRKPIKVTAERCGNCGAEFTKAERDARVASHLKFQLGCFLALLPLLGIGYCALRPSQEEVAAETFRQIEEREQGLHCLTGWHGEHPGVVAQTKAQLRDPESFEHIETRIGRRKEVGTHSLVMKYRARNGFGGFAPGTARAEINSYDCSVSTLTIQ